MNNNDEPSSDIDVGDDDTSSFYNNNINNIINQNVNNTLNNGVNSSIDSNGLNNNNNSNSNNITNSDNKYRHPLNRGEKISLNTANNLNSILLQYFNGIGISETTLNSINNELTQIINNQFKVSNTTTTSQSQTQPTTVTVANINNVNTPQPPPPTTTTTTPSVTTATTTAATSLENSKYDDKTLELLSNIKTIYNECSELRFKGRKRYVKPKKETYTYTHSTVVDQQLESSNAVQITASKEVLNKRIDTFTKKKKDENIDFNTREFRSDVLSDVKNSARAYPFQPSKVKHSTTTNEEGPLVVSEQEREQMKYKPYIEERLNILENHLAILPPIKTETYERVKVLEDKIMEIESKNPLFFKELYESRQKSNNIIIQHK